jgi:hypothetical protein
VAVLLVISLVLAGSGYLTVQHVAFERSATDTVEEVLSGPEYDRLGLVSVEGRFGLSTVLDKPDKVIVVVKRPTDTEFSDLAAALQRRLTAQMNRPITVEVEFRDTTVARPSESEAPVDNHYEVPRSAPPDRILTR